MKNVIRSYYGFQFFFSLLIWLPIFHEYQLRIGLTDTQVFDIQSIYYLAFCLVEIPTGMLADRFGYRRCLIGGGIILVLANLLAIYFQNYQGLLWHFLFVALSRSLVSGASSAYIYDFLKSVDSAEIYRGIEGKARAYGLVGKVVCWVGVGSLLDWQMTSPYWLTTLAAGVSVAFAAVLPELTIPSNQSNLNALSTDRHDSPKKKLLPESLLETLLSFKFALKTVFARPFLLFLMVQGIGLFVLGRICQVNLFQPILASKTIDVKDFGAVMSLMTVFEALGSAYPGVTKRFMGDLKAIFALTFVMALSLALIPWSSELGTVVWLCIFALAAGLSFPIQKHMINDAIPYSHQRATILSLESILDRATCAWVAALVGSRIGGPESINAFLNMTAVITVAGIAILSLALVFLPIDKRENFREAVG